MSLCFVEVRSGCIRDMCPKMSERRNFLRFQVNVLISREGNTSRKSVQFMLF